MRSWLGLLRRWASQIAESHPHIWYIGWFVVRRFRFLLPHDPSYRALRHFASLRPNGLFLDIGANDGISAISFRTLDATSRILSLEPNSLLENQLMVVKSGDALFDYRLVGAGAEASRIQFHVPEYKHILLHTFTSSDRAHAYEGLERSFGKRVASKCVFHVVESDVVRVDDLQISPSIIKIDAEGANYGVLLGALRTIDEARPFVMIEAEPFEREAIAALFSERDYVLLDYHPATDAFSNSTGSTESSITGERNFFAVPSETKSLLAIANSASSTVG